MSVSVTIPAFGGMRIIANEFVPETQKVAVDDVDARMEAMTAHHVLLGLLPLTVEEVVAWEYNGAILCHPNTLASIRAALTP